MVIGCYYDVSQDFDWLKYLRTVFSGVGLEINSTEEVVAYANSYFARLASMLRRTSNRYFTVIQSPANTCQGALPSSTLVCKTVLQALRCIATVHHCEPKHAW